MSFSEQTTAKIDDDRADYDNVAWDRNDAAWEESHKELPLLSTRRRVESLVEKKFGKAATWIPKIIFGGYNALYRVRLEGVSPDLIVRLPQRNRAQFPDEKTLAEAATANVPKEEEVNLWDTLMIPVPRIFFYGPSSDENPDVGPFIILQHVENRRTLSDALRNPNDDLKAPHVLNPNISDSTLQNLYSKWAHCLIQLSQHKFPRIGSLVEGSDGSFSVAARPITYNMNNMVQLANIPRAVLPPEHKTYGTADEWYVALSEMHMAQLVFQHNDLVSSEDDCRNKYVARQLFRKLAKQGRLSTFGFHEDDWSSQSKIQPLIVSPAPARSGSFRLWGDDFQPSNFLLNESNDIVAVVDWELTYCGPTQFVLDPPWALLLEVPEMWPSGIDDWRKVYDTRLKTWLLAMKQAEESIGPDSLPFVLFTYMRESWETGRFWLNYAARKSWAFDTIFWKYLDERFFGSRGRDVPKSDLWRTRVHLLSDKAREAMEPFVKRKMEDSKERILIDWDPEEAKECLSKMFFD